MVVLILGRVLVSGSYALLLLQILICAHRIFGFLLLLDGDVRSLQVFNVDDVVDPFASVGSDVLGL